MTVYTKGNRYRRFYLDGTLTHVAHVVALTFIGPRPPWPHNLVRHEDDDPHNDRARNLSYGTKRDNALDSIRTGRHHHATMTHCAHGHEFTPENTRLEKTPTSTTRRCRQCKRDRYRERTGADTA